MLCLTNANEMLMGFGSQRNMKIPPSTLRARYHLSALGAGLYSSLQGRGSREHSCPVEEVKARIGRCNGKGNADSFILYCNEMAQVLS